MLLGVDPALTNTGLVLLSIIDRGHYRVEWSKTVRAGGASVPLVKRCGVMGRSVMELLGDLLRRRAADVDAIVLEDPTDYAAVGRRRAKTTDLLKMAAAVGAVMAACYELGWRHGVRVVSYGTREWYPRNGSAPMKKEHVLAMLRTSCRPSLEAASEHEAMAAGVAIYHWSQAGP